MAVAHLHGEGARSRPRVPYAEGAVNGAGDDGLSVRGEGAAVDASAVPSEHLRCRARHGH
eukprot:9078640-Pyramimonas_sp.AAC.2